MAQVITVTPQQMRVMSLYKDNNTKLEARGNREKAIRKNKNILKEYHQEIQQTAMEA